MGDSFKTEDSLRELSPHFDTTQTRKEQSAEGGSMPPMQRADDQEGTSRTVVVMGIQGLHVFRMWLLISPKGDKKCDLWI